MTGGGIWLRDCYVRWEKVEISALNQTCYKSTGGVQGEGGLVHWLPVPPVPGLPPHQASMAGTTVLPGGWVLLGQGQVSRWLVSAFQGCTVPWRARQGRSRAITVPRSCRLSALAVTQGCPWIWHIPAAAPQQSVPTLCPTRWQGRGAAWDSPGGQSHLFTPCHSSSEIMSVLSMPQTSCLANPYLCRAHVAGARCQGAGRQHGQGYPCDSDAQ